MTSYKLWGANCAPQTGNRVYIRKIHCKIRVGCAFHAITVQFGYSTAPVWLQKCAFTSRESKSSLLHERKQRYPLCYSNHCVKVNSFCEVTDQCVTPQHILSKQSKENDNQSLHEVSLSALEDNLWKGGLTDRQESVKKRGKSNLTLIYLDSGL